MQRCGLAPLLSPHKRLKAEIRRTAGNEHDPAYRTDIMSSAGPFTWRELGRAGRETQQQNNDTYGRKVKWDWGQIEMDEREENRSTKGGRGREIAVTVMCNIRRLCMIV